MRRGQWSGQTSVIREFCRITAVSSPWSLVTAAADPGLALVSAGPLAGQEPPEVNKTTKILFSFCSVSQNSDRCFSLTSTSYLDFVPFGSLFCCMLFESSLSEM